MLTSQRSYSDGGGGESFTLLWVFMPTLLYTCTSAAKFKEIWLKLRKRRKTCWSDQQNEPVKTSNRVMMGDYILIQSTLFPLIPPLVTIQCHCLGLVNRVTRPHCPLARLQHQPNRTAHPSQNLSEILWPLLQPVLSPSSSLSYHLWTFSKAYQMALMLTPPPLLCVINFLTPNKRRSSSPSVSVRGLRITSTGYSDDYCFSVELHPQDWDTTTGLCTAASRSYFWDLQFLVSPREMWRHTCCWAWASCCESFSRKSYGKMQSGVFWDVKKDSPVGAGMGGRELRAFHMTSRSPVSESVCAVWFSALWRVKECRTRRNE